MLERLEPPPEEDLHELHPEDRGAGPRPTLVGDVSREVGGWRLCLRVADDADLSGIARVQRSQRAADGIDAGCEPEVGHWIVHWGALLSDPTRLVLVVTAEPTGGAPAPDQAHQLGPVVVAAACLSDGHLELLSVAPDAPDEAGALLVAEVERALQGAGSAKAWLVAAGPAAALLRARGWRPVLEARQRPEPGRGATHDGRLLHQRLVWLP